jgi:sigma-B regulation protein RsbU (phosphoserine phosphatase)
LYVDAGGRGLMITCSSPVYDEENTLVGVVAADVTLETLNEAIINTQVGTLGYAFMIDEEGNVIARPGLTAVDKRWDESFTMENLTLGDDPQLRSIAREMIAGNTGIDIARFQDGDKYIAYAPVTSTKWSIGIVMPVDEIVSPALATKNQIISGTLETKVGIDNKISDLRYIFIANLVGVILLVTVLAFVLSRTITRPVRRVTSAARAMEKGEIREEEINLLNQTEGSDEVSILSRVFASMVAQVKARENALKKQVAELQIEIDQVKKAKDVRQITESDYFQRLKETARKIRDKGKE